MNQRVRAAMDTVERKHFVRTDDIARANADRPLSIGHGQTISQPTTVFNMLGWLNVQPGDRVLDVGSGSGWTSALLSFLTGDTGHVTAVERIPDLVTFGRNNCGRAGYTDIEFHRAGDQYGWSDNAPYDRILVSASAGHLPQELVSQLAPGGKLVIPIGDTIHEITKQPNNTLKHRYHPGYVFVPLLPDYNRDT